MLAAALVTALVAAAPASALDATRASDTSPTPAPSTPSDAPPPSSPPSPAPPSPVPSPTPSDAPPPSASPPSTAPASSDAPAPGSAAPPSVVAPAPSVVAPVTPAAATTRTSGASTAGAAQHRLERVYVAPIGGDDRSTARLIGDRVLVAAKSFNAEYDIVGAADVQGILETEAAKAAAGCDSSSCANEIADALNADELVTGALGRIGDTWQLTLTRTERKTLRALGRAYRESHGETPEGLLDDIPSAVREVFGADTGPDVLGVTGIGATVVGAAAFVTGVGLYAWSWLEYSAALGDLTGAVHVASAQAHKQTGEAVLPWGYAVGGAGLAVAALGVGLLLVDGAP